MDDGVGMGGREQEGEGEDALGDGGAQASGRFEIFSS